MIRSSLARMTLTLALGLAGLTATTSIAPVSHAMGDGSVRFIPSYTGSPTISATSKGENEITVTGSHFTPGGSVEILVYDASYNLASTYDTTASVRVCGKVPPCRPGGKIYVGMNVGPCWQTDHVVALDRTRSEYSNWVSVYVYCVQ